MMADWDIATDPTTASGFWWRTVQGNFVPKLLQMAALMAAAGAAAGGGGGDDDDDTPEAIKAIQRMLARVPPLVWAGKILRKVPTYALTQLLVMPLWLDQEGNAVVFTVPQDDNGRILAGIFWKLAGFATGDRSLWQSVTDAIGYGVSQTPSVSPAISTVWSAADYALGRNPFDAFRQKSLLTPDEQKARGYTWQPFRKFVGWEFQQVGGGIVWKFYPGDERPKLQTTGQQILDFPVISDTVGRFVKITKYGDVERARRAGEPAEGRAAARRINEQSAINTELKAYFALPPGEQNVRTQQRLASKLSKTLYPDEKDMKKKAANERRLQRRMALSVAHGSDDALADPVIAADTKEAKIAIIMDAQPTFTPKQFEDWLQAAVRQKVISPQILIDVHKQMRRKPATIH